MRPTQLKLTLLAGGIGLAVAATLLSRGPAPAPIPAPPAPQAAPRYDAPPSTPLEAEQLGRGGRARNFGYDPDPVATERFLDELPHRSLREAAPELFEADPPLGFRDGAPIRGPPTPQQVALAQTEADEPILLYRALYEAHQATYGQPWRVGKQGIGDCVSWGWAHGCDVLLAVDWRLGQSGAYQTAATEAIYGGSRVEARGRPGDGARPVGGWGDGSYGGAAAKWCNRWGVLYRQPYDGLFDLTTYSSQRAKQWGAYGCGGEDDGGRGDELARLHAVQTVALVGDWDELVAAIRNGYPVPVCSGQGFSSHRDGDGFCRASGSWSHCMLFLAVRFDREGVLCLNSWGPNWVDGPKWPDDQPDGSFWVERRVAERMLSGDDSFAVSRLVGFPRRKLRHAEGW